jgi:hypothetical protein
MAYFPVVDEDEDCDIWRSWNRPIPKPPTAPASKPSKISTGKLSRSDFFFFTGFPFTLHDKEVVSFVV